MKFALLSKKLNSAQNIFLPSSVVHIIYTWDIVFQQEKGKIALIPVYLKHSQAVEITD
jgi:hypothetical protein